MVTVGKKEELPMISWHFKIFIKKFKKPFIIYIFQKMSLKFKNAKRIEGLGTSVW